MSLSSKKIIQVDEKPTRHEIFTAIRAIALIFIIISHCTAIILGFYVHAIIFFFLGIIGVNIFVFLSGFLLTLSISSSNTKKISWKNWYKKRIIRIYPSLIIITLIGVLYQFYVNKQIFGINNILIQIGGFYYTFFNPNYTLILSPHWYLSLILTCYLLFPLFYTLLSKYFKFMIILGIFTYILLMFYGYDILNHFLLLLFQKELLRIIYNGFIPRYFIFYLGISLGIWTGRNHILDKNFLEKKKIGIFSLIILIISNVFFFLIYFLLNFYEYLILNILISISFILTFLHFLQNKPKIYSIFEIPGNLSYETFLIHQIPIYIVLILQIKIELGLVYILIVIISSMILAYPIYLFSIYLKNKKRFHSFIIFISLNIITYGILSYTLFLINIPDLNDFQSLLIFILISLILIILICIKKLMIKCSNNKGINYLNNKI